MFTTKILSSFPPWPQRCSLPNCSWWNVYQTAANLPPEAVFCLDSLIHIRVSLLMTVFFLFSVGMCFVESKGVRGKMALRSKTPLFVFSDQNTHQNSQKGSIASVRKKEQVWDTQYYCFNNFLIHIRLQPHLNGVRLRCFELGVSRYVVCFFSKTLHHSRYHSEFPPLFLEWLPPIAVWGSRRTF